MCKPNLKPEARDIKGCVHVPYVCEAKMIIRQKLYKLKQGKWFLVPYE